MDENVVGARGASEMNREGRGGRELTNCFTSDAIQRKLRAQGREVVAGLGVRGFPAGGDNMPRGRAHDHLCSLHRSLLTPLSPHSTLSPSRPAPR